MRFDPVIQSTKRQNSIDVVLEQFIAYEIEEGIYANYSRT